MSSDIPSSEEPQTPVPLARHSRRHSDNLPELERETLELIRLADLETRLDRDQRESDPDGVMRPLGLDE